MTDRIDKTIPLILVGCAAFGAVGYLGAHLVRPLLPAISVGGVSIATALSPAYTLGLLALKPANRNVRLTENERINLITEVAMAVLVAYPLSVLTARIFFAVHPLHPLLSFVVGGGTIVAGAGIVGAVAWSFFAFSSS